MRIPLFCVALQRKMIKEKLDKLHDKIKSEAGVAVLKKVDEGRNNYVGAQDKFLQLMKDNKKEDAKNYLLTDVRPLQAAYIKAVSGLIDYQSELMTKVGEESRAHVQQQLILIITLSAIAIVLGILIGLMITRSLMKQLGG